MMTEDPLEQMRRMQELADQERQLREQLKDTNCSGGSCWAEGGDHVPSFEEGLRSKEAALRRLEQPNLSQSQRATYLQDLWYANQALEIAKWRRERGLPDGEDWAMLEDDKNKIPPNQPYEEAEEIFKAADAADQNYVPAPKGSVLDAALGQGGIPTSYPGTDHKRLSHPDPNAPLHTDSAMLENISARKGGIDFNADQMNLQEEGALMVFEMPPVDLTQLENVRGFVPVIISIRPTDVKALLSLP
jgi:hypothetical protein